MYHWVVKEYVQDLIKQAEENNLHMILDTNGVPNAAYILDSKDHDVLVVNTL